MINTLLLLTFGIAIVLTLLSAWIVSSHAYYAIVSLFAAGFVLDLVGDYLSRGAWNLKGIGIDVCVFGFLFYFVTVQKVMGLKVSSVTTGDAYKTFLLENNKYHGFLKFVYYLPFALIVLGVCIAVYWKFLA
jgi:hypothetical protein